nr:type I-E CRISPR-associated endonuclease Cas1e [uncultured Cohaesibacter sp.]
MLKGRLGLETSRIPHADRAGVLYLARGHLVTSNGTLSFRRNEEEDEMLPKGVYDIPVQGVSIILLGPGSTVSHDALRLLARANTALAAVGEDGVRCYTAPPLMPDQSVIARNQARLWADEKKRLDVARRMYAWRLGEVLPHRDIAVLRGIEGARMKETYRLIADRVGIRWTGRHYDRLDPEAADLPNQALNHAASAVEAAAAIATTATGAIPQLGFIHEAAGQSFVLDIADLYRDQVTIPAAFKAAREGEKSVQSIERIARRMAGRTLAEEKVIPDMIDKIKALLTPQTDDTKQTPSSKKP